MAILSTRPLSSLPRHTTVFVGCSQGHFTATRSSCSDPWVLHVFRTRILARIHGITRIPNCFNAFTLLIDKKKKQL